NDSAHRRGLRRDRRGDGCLGTIRYRQPVFAESFARFRGCCASSTHSSRHVATDSSRSAKNCERSYPSLVGPRTAANLFSPCRDAACCAPLKHNRSASLAVGSKLV